MLETLRRGTGDDGLYRGAPFSLPWNHSLTVASVENAFVRLNADNPGFNPGWATMEIYTANGTLLSAWPNPEWWGEESRTLKILEPVLFTPRVVYDELAVIGGTCWDIAYGHMVHESLGRLLVLDVTLPPHIPLVLQNNPALAPFFDLARKYGAFQRPLVPLSHGVIAAKKLYFVTSKSLSEPIYSWWLPAYYGQIHVGAAFMADWWRRHFHNRAVERNDTLLHRHPTNGIAIMLRPRNGQRGFLNEEELVAAVIKTFDCPPSEARSNTACRPVSIISGVGYVGDGKPPTPFDLDKLGDEMYDACILITPHGAAINNIVLGLRPGCVLVEVHSPDNTHSMFFSLARNIGVQHWSTYATEGSHTKPIRVDVEEILDVIKESLPGTRDIGWYYEDSTIRQPFEELKYNATARRAEEAT